MVREGQARKYYAQSGKHKGQRLMVYANNAACASAPSMTQWSFCWRTDCPRHEPIHYAEIHAKHREEKNNAAVR